MSLQRMISPLSSSRFAENYWEKKPVILEGDGARFAGMFGMTDIARLLQYLKPSPPEGMLLVKGSQHYARRWTNADGTPHPERVRDALQEGFSIIVNGLDKMWEPVGLFAHALQADLHHPVDVNLYVTPPDSQAFSYHWDIMDVFILQVEGSKSWKVHEAAADRPLPDEHADVDPKNLPPVIYDQTLTPGDMLYIPRGFVHAAHGTDSTSLHLSVGVHPKTWADLFSAAVLAARSNDQFRGALPPGYFSSSGIDSKFKELAATLTDLLDGEAALGRLAQDWFVNDPPPPGDAFLKDMPDLTPDTVLRIRNGVISRMIAGPGYAGVQYSGGRIIGPGKIQPALKAILDRKVFPLGSLEDALSAREAKVLAGRLVKDGLLEVAPTEDQNP